MNIYLFEKNKIISFELPAKRIGDFWLKDSEDANMVNISAGEGDWILSPSKNTKIYDAYGNTENIALKIKSYYIVEKGENKFLLYCDYGNDTTFKNYLVRDGSVVSVGSAETASIVIPLSNI